MSEGNAVSNGYTIDHVAIVVKDLEATIALYVATLGFRQIYRETVADQGAPSSHPWAPARAAETANNGRCTSR